MPLAVERLDKGRHDIKAFECEEEYFTDYLVKSAWKHGQRRMNVTYVAVDPGEPRTIKGYMTLSMGHVEQGHVDAWAVAGLPRFPLPVLHLGLLATDRRHKRQGVGDALVAEAMLKAAALSEEVGCHALQLKAASEDLVAYYRRYDFVRMKEGELLMFLPVATILDGMENPPDPPGG